MTLKSYRSKRMRGVELPGLGGLCTAAIVGLLVLSAASSCRGSDGGAAGQLPLGGQHAHADLPNESSGPAPQDPIGQGKPGPSLSSDAASPNKENPDSTVGNSTAGVEDPTLTPPTLSASSAPPSSRRAEIATFDFQWRVILLTAFVLAYVVILGATIGSFLNVIVYRMPLGMGVIRPRSFCPICKTPIKATDNIPVLGWIKLRGKCRTCRTPISPRYPIVEGVLGSVFGLLALLLVLHYVEIVRDRGAGMSWTNMVLVLSWGFLPPLVYVAAWGIFQLGAYLFTWDRRQIPWRFAVWFLLFGFVLPLFQPAVRYVPSVAADPQQDRELAGGRFPMEVKNLKSTPLTGVSAGLADAAAGLAAGLFAASAASGFFWRRTDPLQRNLLLTLAISGLFLGWQRVTFQALLIPACYAVVAIVMGKRFSRQQGLVFSAVLSAALEWVLWRYVARYPWGPGPAMHPLMVVVSTGVLTAGVQMVDLVFFRKENGLADPPKNEN